MKLDRFSSYDPATAFLGIYPKEMRNDGRHKNLPIGLYHLYLYWIKLGSNQDALQDVMDKYTVVSTDNGL